MRLFQSKPLQFLISEVFVYFCCANVYFTADASATTAAAATTTTTNTAFI